VKRLKRVSFFTKLLQFSQNLLTEKMKKPILFITLVAFAACEVELEGANVCERIETHNETAVSTEMVPYEEVKSVWCASVPPRCRKVITKLREENVTKVTTTENVTRECCEGYKQHEKFCIPVCESCVHGLCYAPNECLCDDGFYGLSCNSTEVITTKQDNELEGMNVCHRLEPYNDTIIVTEMVPYQEVKTVWCAAVPPRCKKSVIKLRQQNTTEIVEKTRSVAECCEGFRQINSQCVALEAKNLK